MSSFDPHAAAPAETDPEAAKWAVRRASGPLTPNEQAAYADWLRRRGTAGADAVSARQAVWDDPALTAALAAASRKVSVRPAAPAPSRRQLLGFAAAAGVAGIVAAPHLVRFVGGLGVEETLIRTVGGERRRIDLTDGSMVEANGDTTLRLRLGPEVRTAEILRGEAFFDVRNDPRAPFDVQAGHTRLSVAESKFNLGLGSGDTVELSVYHGAIAVDRSAPDSGTVLAGQRAYFLRGTLQREESFSPGEGDWRTGWLDVREISLAALAERLSRHSRIPIHVRDDRLARKSVAGRFRIDDPERLLVRLARIHGFRVRRDYGALILEPLNPGI